MRYKIEIEFILHCIKFSLKNKIPFKYDILENEEAFARSGCKHSDEHKCFMIHLILKADRRR